MKTQNILSAAALVFAMTPVHALVMDFGSGPGSTIALGSSFSQSGMTMSPVNTGNTSNSFNHWDLHRNTSGATSSDWSAGIHTGNEAEVVEFSFAGAAFDLLSFDIENIVLDLEHPTYDLIGTFTSSNGATTSVSTIGTIDFSTLSGFQNITSFQFGMPLGVAGSCDVPGQNCSTMIFDNIVFREAASVPEPTTAWLLGVGLLGMIGFSKRKA